MIVNALAGKPLPVYGDGGNVRDWLYVGDHCAAMRAVLEAGRPGETYNVGGNAEMTNLDVVRTICDIVADCTNPDATMRRRSRSSRTAPGTTAATRSTRRRSAASSDGRRRRRSNRACGARSRGISTTAHGLRR